MHKPLFLFAGLLFGAAASAQTAPLAPVEQTVLARDAFATGLLDREAGAFGASLWRGSDAAVLRGLLKAAPGRPASPSIGVAARRLLLSGGETPLGADASLGGEKLKALVRLGFIAEAREIESLAIGGKSDASLIEAMATADLLSGENAAACQKAQRISSPRDNAYGAKLRAFCYALAGELDAADLALKLLRERGALSPADEAILGPMAAGARPKAGAQAVDGVHYGALRQAGLAVSLAPDAEAGLLSAVSRDPDAPLAVRLAAAKRASAMGVMSGAALRDLFGGAGLGVAAVAGGAEAFRQQPDDPAALAAAFQLARSKSAPEFARDRAALVAGVLSAARDFDTHFLAAVLFADDVKSFEGMLVSNEEAEAFALARLALGDVGGAEAWLAAGAAGGLGQASDAAALVAAAKAGAADRRGAAVRADGDLALAVDAVIEAAAERITGQAALAALAASDLAAQGDPVADIVVTRGLDVAGVSDLARRRTAERLLQQRFARAQPAPVSPAPGAGAPAGDAKSPAPRLKPAPSR